MTQLMVTDDDRALRECERCVIQFIAHFDSGNYDGAIELFAPDGVWQRQGEVLRGREELRQWAASRTGAIFVRHVLSNLMARQISEDTIEVESYVTVYRHDFAGEPVLPAPFEGPALVGRYFDVLSRIDGVWLISHKSVVIDFKR